MKTMPNKTLGDFLHWAERLFLEADLYYGHGTNNAWDEACALAIAVLMLDPEVEADVASRPLNSSELGKLQAIAEERVVSRKPLPYLIHEAWFAGLKFYVDERVIIPRSPMAEVIQDRFEPWWRNSRPIRRILDLCTGSGCIAIAAAMAFPEARVDAIDISDEALSVAAKNVELHQVFERVRLIKSDLFQKVPKAKAETNAKLEAKGVELKAKAKAKTETNAKAEANAKDKAVENEAKDKACEEQRYDIIISNPPYVSAQEMSQLPEEYRYEPTLALMAEQEGLAVVDKILSEALHFLVPGGLLLVEVGNGREAVTQRYPALPFLWLEFERGGEGVFLLEAGENASCWSTY